jgi:uncharacterized protein (DUF1499 family)
MISHFFKQNKLRTRAFLGLLMCLTLSACSGSRPAYLGTAQSSLQPCPSSPNCVSSLDDEEESHRIAPFSTANNDISIANLVELISSNPSAKVIVDSENYLYAEYTSSLMGFVDDVEFLVNAAKQRIDVRSASRVGRSDFGVNRERIESLRQELSEK